MPTVISQLRIPAGMYNTYPQVTEARYWHSRGASDELQHARTKLRFELL